MFTLGPKVLTPALLFAVLSPGLIVTLPNKLLGSTSPLAQSLVYALLYLFVYNLVATQLMGLVLTQTDLLVTAGLYFLLNIRGGGCGVNTVVTRTIIFICIFAFLRKQFPQFY